MSAKGSKIKAEKVENQWGTTYQGTQNQMTLSMGKREFPEIGTLETKQGLKKSRPKSTGKTVSIAEIKGLIRNPKQFMWIYGVEMGYHLPPKAYVTWPYMIAILTGKKKLIKSKSLSLSISVPKIEQLSMRVVWPKVQNLDLLDSFMPMLSPGRYPPRKFFFEILHTRFRFKFEELVKQAKDERREQMVRDRLMIRVDPAMFDELNKCTIWNDISTSQISKRVTVTRVSRIRR